MSANLDFEKPIVELEERLKELRSYHPDNQKDIRKFEERLEKLKKELFMKLSPWQITHIARHPQRPYTLDYISLICDDFIELHGDRAFKDDLAMVGGVGSIDGRTVMIIGHQKGRTTKEKVAKNFGMPHPEGYRKALRLMRLAERFSMPVIAFIDTPGAFPGIGAEERGQAEAIAKNLEAMALLRTPIAVFIIGEGGSGGALGIGVGDRVLMLEYAVYSVISPEGCAAILWKDGNKADVASNALKMVSNDLLNFGVVDKVVREPLGGAHRDYKESARLVKEAIVGMLDELKGIPIKTLLAERYKKYRNLGRFLEKSGK